jgi:hypothetical protein
VAPKAPKSAIRMRLIGADIALRIVA